MATRLFFEPLEGTIVEPGAVVALRLDDTHYIKTVLRLPAGSQVIATDALSGRRFKAVIALGTTDKELLLRLDSEHHDNRPKSRVLCIAPALLKGDHNDLVCEKCCELGVRRILFWQAERSVVRVATAHDIEKKLRRFEAIARGAAQQSDRCSLPEVQVLRSLAELIALLSPGEPILLASLEAEAQPASAISLPTQSLIQLVVGPEGDFSPSEINSLIALKAHKLSLGPLVLRSETAAIAGVATLNAIYGYCD